MEICFFASVRVQNNVRSVLVHSIFRKSLWIPDHALDIGKISNLMATDADKIGKWTALLFQLSQWSWTFFSLPILVYFLYGLVGSAAFIGMTMIILGATTSRSLGLCLQHYTRIVQDCRDHRARLMSEMVRGIRTVKLQVWEPIWHERITEARNREMRAIVRVRILTSFNSLVGSVLSVMVPVTVFAWYTLVNKKALDAATAFTALAWISTLQWSVQSLPGIYNAVANLKPSIKRIDEFLTAPINGTRSRGPGRPLDLEALEGVEGMEGMEQEMSQMSQMSMSNGHTVHRHDTPRPWRAEPWLETGTRGAAPMAVVSRNAVEVSNATFGYRSGTDSGLFETCVLEKLNFQVKAGSFVMTAGAVGSGKSTLLASLACARPALHGFCETKGRRAYVPQKPFLLNGTVKENIVFGLPLDDERYNSALEMSALPDDLKTLTSGDATLVGESGVQLSGGQKARVALARAIYADADVVCLDDVLSAVDAHTARFIWQKCFIEGFLKMKKTVILVSHQIQYLSRPEVDSVIMLRDGKIWLQGPWAELAHSGDSFLSLVQAWEQEEDELEAEAVETTEKKSQASNIPISSHISHQVGLHECQDALSSVLAALDGRRIDPLLIRRVREAMSGQAELQTDLIREGAISWPDFKVYLKAFGSIAVISLMLVLMVFAAVSQIMATLWLAAWTSGKEANGFYARLPGCVSPTLLSPSARAPPMSPKSPTSPISPGKRIRRNAAVLGIPLDLRRGQASLPLPVRNILGDIICPMDLQGIYLDTSEQQPTYVMPMTSAGDTGRAVVATTATGTTGRAAPLQKVVRGGA